MRNTHADDAAVLAKIADIRGSISGLRDPAVYGASDIDKELIPVDVAAAQLGIEPKRLRGYMFRNKIGDPVGDGRLVYGWSLEPLRKRIAAQPITVSIPDVR